MSCKIGFKPLSEQIFLNMSQPYLCLHALLKLFIYCIVWFPLQGDCGSIPSNMSGYPPQPRLGQECVYSQLAMKVLQTANCQSVSNTFKYHSEGRFCLLRHSVLRHSHCVLTCWVRGASQTRGQCSHVFFSQYSGTQKTRFRASACAQGVIHAVHTELN